MNRKCVLLYSGGLDSILACKILLEQSIKIFAINFTTPFLPKADLPPVEFPLKVINIGEEYLELVKNPRYGYGKNLNPCIDCKIAMFERAKEYMDEIGASFIATGEVVGERPMSQRKDALNIIDRDSEMRGLVVRPLSAKLLKPTIPEVEGIIDREKLLDISGRSRKPQLELAKKYGLKDYPTPSGGCLLTDPIFSKRVKDTMDNDKFSIEKIYLLRYGRHFRLNDGCKVVVGRNEIENNMLLNLCARDDYIFRVVDYVGPVVILLFSTSIEDLTICTAASLTASYSKGKNEKEIKVVFGKRGKEKKTIFAKKMERDKIKEYMI